MFTEAEVKAAKDYAALFLMNGYVVETYEGDGGWITVECRVYPDKDSVDDILHQIREDEEGRLWTRSCGTTAGCFWSDWG